MHYSSKLVAGYVKCQSFYSILFKKNGNLHINTETVLRSAKHLEISTNGTQSCRKKYRHTGIVNPLKISCEKFYHLAAYSSYFMKQNKTLLR